MLNLLFTNLIWCGSCWSAIKVREEIVEKSGTDASNEDEALKVARSKKFYSYIYHMIRTFGGGALANLTLGVSPLAPFVLPTNFITATIAWYTVFFFPGDYMYQFYVKNKFVYMYLETFNEILRVIRVELGVQSAVQTRFLEDEVLRVIYFPVVGTIKGVNVVLTALSGKFGEC